MTNAIKVFNIREYLLDTKDKMLGEEALRQILSEFSCKKNTDIEKFLKEQSIEFTKKNQSVTYLVLSEQDATLLGYFTLTIKPISVNTDAFSNTLRRKIARVGNRNETDGTYMLSAYLIAQLGKNYADGLNEKITGEQLLEVAINTIREIQYMAGGMVVFLEAEDNEKLLKFYEIESGFKKFATRYRKNEVDASHMLVQLLKIL